VLLVGVAGGVTAAAVGWPREKSPWNKDTIQIMLIYVLFYFIVIYLLGLVAGFVRNAYSLAPLTILKNIAPVVVLIVLEELWRWVIVRKSAGKKWLLVLTAVLFVAFDSLMAWRGYHLDAALELFSFIGIVVMGSITKNAMLTFLSYKSSYKPTLVYALIFGVTPYILPIIPDLGPYINSVVGIILPTLLLIRYNEYFTTRRPIPGRESRGRKILALVPSVAVLATLVVLVSGVFRYWAMAIGSGSMTGAINMGDAVIIDKGDKDLAKIQPGTVIAFHHDGETIVHRLISVNTTGEVIGQTKGDYNPDPDAWQIGPSDVVGVVKFRIPVVGWPTVWIEQTFSRSGH
jgi:signal peptidase